MPKDTDSGFKDAIVITKYLCDAIDEIYSGVIINPLIIAEAKKVAISTLNPGFTVPLANAHSIICTASHNNSPN